MKLYHLPLSLISLCLFACNYSKPPNRIASSDVKTDTLTYQYKTIKQRAGDCGSKPDSTCTSAVITYPFFEGQMALNDTINQRLSKMFGGDYRLKATNIQDAATRLIKLYNQDKKQGSIQGSMYYTLDSHARVIDQDSTLLAIELSGYYYEGGAHGMTITNFLNWDTKNKKPLGLDDIFVSGYQPKLTQIADTIFRKEELLSPTASLAHDYFFKDAKFSLNDNFVVTPTGIKFLYNAYEIKPYAAGQTSIEIPYNKLKKLIKPDSPAAIYVR
ncbi:hypothetical protein GCM10027037_06700 [Mucilaginibacter koreensis]